MRTLIFVTAWAVAGTFALPASAQFATPHPLSEKYRDAGAKPATGRSGSAAIQVRGLRGSDGTTQLEVTTGQFDTSTAPVGRIDKVQVKLTTGTGAVLQTDNYRKSLSGTGYTALFYDNLPRGQNAQVQANVSGIDPDRTDVVTVSTQVKLRPDVEATSVQAPAQAVVDAPITVTTTMSEINGDVGARATCELLADGVSVGSVPGAWVDAGSAVSCTFMTAFPTPGTRTLTLRVSGVTPGDYDLSNNVASTTVEVVDASQPFNYYQVWAQEYQGSWDNRWDRVIHWSSGATQTETRRDTGMQDIQSYGAFGQFYDATPAHSGGTLALEHSMDGTSLPTVSVNVTDIPMNWGDSTYGCRYGILDLGLYVQACGYGGYNDVAVQRIAGVVAYVSQYVVNGQYSWYNTVTYDYGPKGPPFGTSYRARLTYENGTVSRSNDLSATIVPSHYDNASSGCSTYSWPDAWADECWSYMNTYDQRYGYNIAWY